MKLLFIKKGFIYFYFFILISLHSFIYSDATLNYNYAKLDKYKSYQLYSSSYNYFFLDIASFEGEDYLYFKLDTKYIHQYPQIHQPLKKFNIVQEIIIMMTIMDDIYINIIIIKYLSQKMVI